MTGPSAAEPSFHGSLYVSPHEDDALMSCPGRMLAELAQGARVSVALAFSSGPPSESGEAAQALERLGVAVTRLGLAPAPERNDFYKSFTRTCFERHAEDDRLLSELSERILELAIGSRARDIYLPLGAGGHVDHRLCHEAGLRALHDATGRNVFFYEERPQAFVPGMIRARLAELGVRLPPVAADIRDDPSIARAFVAFAFAPFLKSERLSPAERLRAARRFARGLRRARAWRPTRAFGLRLQPVVETPENVPVERVWHALSCAERRVARLFGSRQRLESQARRYTERLGAFGSYLERYWLLLPVRDESGMAIVTDVTTAG